MVRTLAAAPHSSTIEKGERRRQWKYGCANNQEDHDSDNASLAEGPDHWGVPYLLLSTTTITSVTATTEPKYYKVPPPPILLANRLVQKFPGFKMNFDGSTRITGLLEL